MIFKSNAQRGEDQYLKGNYQRAAEYFSRAREWKRAADSYARSGQLEKAVEICEAHGLFQEAGRYLADLGQHGRASLSFEKAGDLRQAAMAALQARSLERAGRLYEKNQDYGKAADCFFEAGNTTRGVDALGLHSHRLREQRGEQRDPVLDRQVRETDLRRASILADGLGREREAADLYTEHGQFRTAAPLFEKAGAYAEAARAFLDADQPNRALDAITQVPSLAEVDQELLAEIYKNIGQYSDAATILEGMGRRPEAADAFERAEAWEDAARLWEQEDEAERAAHLYMRAKKYSAAGRCYLEANEPKHAAGALVAAGETAAAARAYLQAGEPLEAGLQFLEAGLDDEARKALLTIEPTTKKDYVRASLHLIPLLIDEDSVQGAARRLHRIRKVKGLPQTQFLYCQGRLAEAEGRGGAAEKFYQQVVSDRHDYRDAHRRLRRLRNERSATQPTPVQMGADPRRTGHHTARVPATSTGPLQAAPRQTGSRQTGSRQTSSSPSATGARQTGASAVVVGEVDASSTAPPPAPTVPLAFAKGGVLAPWWDAAEFFEGRRRDGNERVFLVCYPADEARAKTLEVARRRTTRLNHPAMLRLLEVAHGDGEDVLVYEDFPGQTLDARLLGGPQGPPPPLAALQVIVQLCEALAGAHKLGLIHRALSPRTVLVDSNHRVKLAGLGLGEALEVPEAQQSHLGPESRDGGVAGPASDVYSLGRLAITLLQARMPPEWVTSETLDPDSVGWDPEVENTLPAKVREVLLRCLDHDPLRRPSMDQLQASLTSIGLLPGQMIADRYEVQGQIGSGGMSRVYRARDRVLGDEVAIKTVLTPASGVGNDDEERLLREVQISRKISHPNVVRVHDIGRFPGGIFVSMELLAGPGLDEIIEQEAPLALDRVKGLLLEISAALGEAHRLNVIHRDLKPGNVMLGDDGRAKVLDFGIARQNDGSTGHLTRTGEVIGSPLYMAPEQIQGKPLDGACDLYALGVIAYTLLSGREPFLGDSPTAIVLQHVHDQPPDPRQGRPDLPEVWVDFLNRLLAKDPKGRYASAEAVAGTVRELPGD